MGTARGPLGWLLLSVVALLLPLATARHEGGCLELPLATSVAEALAAGNTCFAASPHAADLDLRAEDLTLTLGGPLHWQGLEQTSPFGGRLSLTGVGTSLTVELSCQSSGSVVVGGDVLTFTAIAALSLEGHFPTIEINVDAAIPDEEVHILVEADSERPGFIRVSSPLTPALLFSANSVDSIAFRGGAGREVFHLGALPSSCRASLEVDGGSGSDEVHIDEALVGVRSLSVDVERLHSRAASCGVALVSATPVTINAPITCTGGDFIDVTAPCISITAAISVQDGDILLSTTGTCTTGVSLSVAGSLASSGGAIHVDGVGDDIGIHLQGDVTVAADLVLDGDAQSPSAASPIGVWLHGCSITTGSKSPSIVRGTTVGAASGDSIGAAFDNCNVNGLGDFDIGGRAGTGPGSCKGVVFDGAAVSVSDLSIGGDGGESVARTNIGIELRNSAFLEGDVVVLIGNGGGSIGGADSNHGVLISQACILLGQSSVDITGRGGLGSISVHGVDLEATAVVEVLGVGLLSIDGTSGGAGDACFGVSLSAQLSSSDGDTLIIRGDPRSAASARDLVGVRIVNNVITWTGTVSITGVGGVANTDSFGIEVLTSSILVVGQFTMDGTGNGILKGAGVYIASSDIEGRGFDFSISGAGGSMPAPSGTSNLGVRFADSFIENSVSGDLRIVGAGGDGTFAHGIVIADSSNETTFTGVGSATFTGTSTVTSLGSSHGVFIDGLVQLDTFTDVSFVGTGAPSTGSHGVVVAAPSLVDCSTKLLLQGTAVGISSGTDSIGVQWLGQIVSAPQLDITGFGGLGTGNTYGVQCSGDTSGPTPDTVSISGTGGTGANGSGVEVTTSIRSSSSLTITGTGGSSSGSARGVDVSGTLDCGGLLAITGTGTASVSSSADGIVLGGSSVVASAGMSLFGTGGTGSSSSVGVGIKASVMLALSPGNVSIVGTGGNSGTGSNVGVLIETSISASGTMLIAGAGGDSGASASSTGNHGLQLSGLLQATGSLTVDIVGGGGSMSSGVQLDTLSAGFDSLASDVRAAGGPCDGAGISCHGFHAVTATSLASSGTLTLEGTASSSSNGRSIGVLLEGGANLNGVSHVIRGDGGGGALGGNVGLAILGDVIGSGIAQFTGNGGAGESDSHGVVLNMLLLDLLASSVFMGVGGGDLPATGSENHGISLATSGVLASTGATTLIGGGGFGHSSVGIHFSGVGPFTFLSLNAQGFGGSTTHPTIGGTAGILVEGALFLDNASLAGRGGTGAGSCHGIDIQARVASPVPGGAIIMQGTHGGDNGSNGNVGVIFQNAGTLEGNQNTVTIKSTCQGTSIEDNNVGVFILTDQAFGDIDLTIEGLGCGIGLGGHGVVFESAIVSFEGRLNVTGTGGSTSTEAFGVNIDNSPFFSSSAATLYSFTGIGRTLPGINLDSSSSLSNTLASVTLELDGSSTGATGTVPLAAVVLKGPITLTDGDLTVAGLCEDDVKFCTGVIIDALIASGTGGISVSGTAGTGDNIAGVNLAAGSSLSTDGAILLQGTAVNAGDTVVAVQISGTVGTNSQLDILALCNGAGVPGERKALVSGPSSALVSENLNVDARVTADFGTGVEVQDGAFFNFAGTVNLQGRVTATSSSQPSTGVLLASDVLLVGDPLLHSATFSGRVSAPSLAIGLSLAGSTSSVITNVDTEFSGEATCTSSGCTGLFMSAGMDYTQDQSSFLHFVGTGVGSDTAGIVAATAPVIHSSNSGDVMFQAVASGASLEEAISLPGFSFASAKAGGLLWFNGATRCPALAIVADPIDVQFTKGGTFSGFVDNAGTTIIESNTIAFSTDGSLDIGSNTATIAATLDASGAGTGMSFNAPVLFLKDTFITGDNKVSFFRTTDCFDGSFDLNSSVFVEFHDNVGSTRPFEIITIAVDGCLLSANNLVLTANEISFVHSGTCTVDVPGEMLINSDVSLFGVLASVGSVDIRVVGDLRTNGLVHPIVGSGDVSGNARLLATMDTFSWVVRGASEGDGRSQELEIETTADFSPGFTSRCYQANNGLSVLGTLTMELDGSNSPCTSEDRIILQGGQITIGASATLVITGSPSLSAGDQLFLTDGAGSITGSFAGLPEHTAVPGCVGPCIISYTGSTLSPPGFDIVLTGNSPPVAMDDFFAVSGTTVTTIDAPGVLANDGDPDSADVLTASLVTAPSIGTFSFNPDGSFVFVPPGVPGPMTLTSFTYNAVDDFGATSLATVTLSVGPGPSVSPAPTPPPTTTNTPSPTPSSSVTPLTTPSPTPSHSASVTPVSTATPTSSTTVSTTASISATASETTTSTNTASSSQSGTPTNTFTPTHSTTASSTPSNTQSTTPSSSAQRTPSTTKSQSVTPSNTVTSTPTRSPTSTSSSTFTSTSTSSSTSTPTSTSSATQSPTSSQTQTSSGTATSTLSADSTPILSSATFTPTPSTSITPTPTSSTTPSKTPSTSSSRTESAPNTPSNTGSRTPLSTTSPTPSPSSTASTTPPSLSSASSSRSKSVSMILVPSAAVGPSNPAEDFGPSPSRSRTPTPLPSFTLPSASPSPIVNGDDVLGSCDFETITVGSGAEPASVDCGNGIVVTVSTSTDVPLVISPGDPILIAQAGTEDVVSAVVDVRLLDGTEVPETEICLTVSTEVDDSSCLAFIDESRNPPEWRCEDSCLEYDSSTAQACGSTDHFTNFAILLDGGSAGGDPCGSSTNDFITGVWWGDLLLAACCFTCVCSAALLFALLVSFFPPARRLFRGSTGYQAARMRTMTNAQFRNSTKLASFNSEAAYAGNI